MSNIEYYDIQYAAERTKSQFPESNRNNYVKVVCVSYNRNLEKLYLVVLYVDQRRFSHNLFEVD